MGKKRYVSIIKCSTVLIFYDKIEKQKMEVYRIKNSSNILPDYTKKIKELLNLKKSKKELYDMLIEKIQIDKDRNIIIKYKYDVIPESSFTYEDRYPIHNPNGRKGKKFSIQNY